MKTNTKLVAAAAAVLAAGLLGQTAKAGAVVGVEYDANLTETQFESPINYQGSQFTLRSMATLDSNPLDTTFGDYFYSYSFGTPTTNPLKLAPPTALSAVSVYFDTAATGAFGAGASAGTPSITPGAVNWNFQPLSKTEMFSFWSPDAPGFGSATALNGGIWAQNTSANDLVVVPIVPNVPDTATTLSLLGGAIVGLGALRRKIGC